MSKLNNLLERWRRISDVALPIVDDAMDFKENFNLLGGMRFALSAQEHYENIFGKKELTFFSREEWKYYNSGCLNGFVIEILIDRGAKLIPLDKKDIFFKLSYQGIEFGYKIVDEGENKRLFFRNDADLSLLRDLFWDNVERQALISIPLNSESFTVSKYAEKPSFETELSTHYTKEIKAYKSKDYNRSILFYGPPGTGKSNLAARILKNLNYKTLIFNNIADLDRNWFYNNIDFMFPDAVLIEDLDQVEIEDRSGFLEIIELLSQKKIMVLATCNKVASMDDALIRAGRFDELVRISKLDESVIKQLISDPEIFEQIKDFPVAAILEVKKRLEVLGKEQTLTRMSDLKSRYDKSALVKEYDL